MLAQLRTEVRSQIDYGEELTDQHLLHLSEQVVLRHSMSKTYTAQEKAVLVKRLYHSFRGLDILQPLMDDASVTEIMINHHAEIFVERAGRLVQLDIAFESQQRLEHLIQNIVASINRVVNESVPIVDARLADGSRVSIVLPPIALKGPCVTIRKFAKEAFTLEELIQFRSLTTEAASFLSELIRCQYNIFISGGTGTGKTTFLSALSRHIPSDERIVTIEDSAELKLGHIANWVALETRNANTEGKGEITIRDLIRASLRMRPNRIIVGEVRGGECLDMLQALNTGHSGSMSTGHSNGARDMVARLETMALSGAELPIPVIRKQISSAIDIIVHLSRFRDRSRRVMEISEVCGMKDGEVHLVPLFEFVETGEKDGQVIGQLRRTEANLQNTSKLHLFGSSLIESGEEK